MITLAAIPLKNCRQCSHYRGGFCYGFGTAKKIFSESEAILCGTFTPLGQVQIGPLDSLSGQLKEFQIPAGIIPTIKLADAAVTVDKLAASSVINSKVAGDAGIIESKLNLDFETAVLNALIATNIADIATNVTGISINVTDIATNVTGISTNVTDIASNVIDIASNLALILLREETANKDQASGYLGLDAGAKVPLSKLNPLTNSEIDASAEIVESKLNLAFGTSALNTDIQTREESSNKGVASGYCDLDAGVHIPLTRLADLTNSQLAAAAAIIESKLDLDHSTQSLFDKVGTDIGTHAGVTDSHHAKYTDAEAVTAIQALAELVLSGDLHVVGKLIKTGTYGSIGNTYSSSNFFAGMNAEANQTEATWPIVQNTHATLGARGILMDKTSGFRFLVEHGAVTAGDPVSTIIAQLTETGAFTIEGDLTAPNVVTAGNVDGVDVSEEPARITTEIDADIATHAEIASAHHTAYTDAMALAAVDEHLVLESENAEWINCPFEGSSVEVSDLMTTLGVIHPVGNSYFIFSVPLPTNRGGKKLHINGTRVSLMNADASNKVVATYINGHGNSTKSTLDTDPTVKDSVGLHEDTSMTEDCSAYHVIKVALSCAVATPGNLHIQFVTVRYYYA